MDGSANSQVIAKPAPRLAPESNGFTSTFANLGWLFTRVLRAHPKSAAVWIVTSVFGGLMVPVQLWATKGVVDNLQERIEGQPGSMMWWFAAAWVAAMSFALIAEQAEGYFGATARERGGSSIAAETLTKATSIELSSFEDQHLYDRISLIMTEAEDKAKDVVTQIVMFGWTIPRVVAWTVALLVVDWRLVPMAFVPLIPGVWAWFFSGTIYWHVYREQTRDRRLATYYTDLLTDRSASREIRLFGLSDTLITRWEQLYWKTARELRRRGLTIALRQRAATFLTSASLLFSFAWYVGFSDKDLSAGTAVVVATSFLSLIGGVLNLGEPTKALGQAAGFASELRGFLAMPDEGDSLPHASTPSTGAGELRLEHVSFAYPGHSVPVVDDVSLTVHAGETIALVGENGAGKTTLVKLMLGLYRPDAGRVLLDGVDIAELDPIALRQRLSGVFQHFVRYPLSVTDNIGLGSNLDRDDVSRALELAGMRESISRLPNEFDTVLSPDLGGVDLSGGQWQRLAIARASTRDAVLLCLDEPTASLDPMAEVAIFRRFAALSQDRTTILVSHRLGMARLADRVVVLEHGRIVEHGTHDELVTRDDSEYRRMWTTQARWYQ